MTLERRVVIVPVDRPIELSREALRLGAQLAEVTNRHLVVVHVDATFGIPDGHRWIDETLPGGAEVVVESTSARPADVILHKIRRAGAPWVVMATAARRLATPAWGSVTERVVSASPVPVFVVGPEVVSRPDAFAGPVTLCLDGTATADAMIEPAMALATETGAAIDLVGVSHASSPQRRRDPERWGVSSVEQHLDDVAAGPLVAARLHGEPARLDASHVVDALVRRVREQRSSALAMATHGRSGLERLALGSVVVAAAHVSPVPVFTVAATGARVGRCPE